MLSDEVRAVDSSLNLKLDMDDAIQYTVAKKLGAKAIVSFDKHFEDLDIPRVEPKQVVRV